MKTTLYFANLIKMEKFKRFKIMGLIILSWLWLISCTKREELALYDLFPLKIGNEFYYKYLYEYSKQGLIGNTTKGTEKWTVLSDQVTDNSIEYKIELKIILAIRQ